MLWMRNTIHATVSCFPNSGYLPAWGSAFAPSRPVLLLMKLPADMGQKIAWKNYPWEQLCHESVRQKRHRETYRLQRDCHVSPGADLFPGFQAGNAEEVCCRYCFMLCKKPSRGLDFLWAPWFREAVNTVWNCTKKEVKEKWLTNNAEYLSISVWE